ncbi:hypothetical protein FRB90_006917, partial [Tulasnella sp. 427]
MAAFLLYALLNTNNSSPGMESEFSNDSSARGSPPSSSSATSVSVDSFISSGIDNSPFASFQAYPITSMSPSASTAGPDLASLFPGMDMNVNNLQIGQQDPQRSAETSIPASSATSSSSAFSQSLPYPLDHTAADAGAGRFTQGPSAQRTTNLADPLAFLDQSALMTSQPHFQQQHQHAF